MKHLILIILLSLSLSENYSIVWNYLKKEGLSNSGAAGVMGSLVVESGLESCFYDPLYGEKIGYISSQEYCDKVNYEEYSAYDFINDNISFGLAKWKNPLDKGNLFFKCKGKIGDLECQLEYLIHSLKTKKSTWEYLTKNTEDNIEMATITFVMEYLKPENTKDYHTDLRYHCAKKFYNKFVLNMN